MSIGYDSEKRLFHLKGSSFSYVLYVDDDGRLLNLYWGALLPDADLRYLLKSVWDGASFDLRESRLPEELPTRGGGYYGLPAVCAVNAAGDDFGLLRYESHEIRPGKQVPAGLPGVYCENESEADTLVITLRDPLTGLTVQAVYGVLSRFDALTRSLILTNCGASSLTLTHMMSAGTPLYGKDYDLIYLNGAWARERRVVREHLSHASVCVESQRGASGHENNPFIALCEPSATEFIGEVRALTLLYSGSFLARAEVSNADSARISIGLNPEVCRVFLEPGEEFVTPEALMVYSDEGLGGMSRIFHRVIASRVMRGVWRDRERPILINNWEATYFSFNEESLLKIAAKARDAGIELFVLDDGWFGHRDTDNCSLGDWVPDKKKLPGGVRGIAEKINALGLKFGLWFEPEMVSPDSDLYRAHPDWCLHADGRPRTESRNQLILDLSRREVQDYLIDAVGSVLSSAPIAYVKWDMNRNMTWYSSEGIRPERAGEVQHRYLLGLYRILEEITARFPEVLFEGCSGGGGRFDAGMLYYMPQIWTSDDSDAAERLRIQYGTSLVYPPCAMGAHVSACPNHQTGRVTALQTRADVAMSGNFGFELDLNKLSDEEFELICKTVRQVKQYHKVTQNGSFTRLESPFEGNHTVWQFLSADENTLLLCVFRVMAEPNEVPHRVFPRGLDPNARYRRADSGEVYSGAALMHAGLPMERRNGDYVSRIYTLEKLH